MMAATVRVSSKGQIVIPKEVREAFHWQIGSELTLVATNDGVMLHSKTAQTKHPASSLRGFLKYTGNAITTEQLCRPVELADDRI